MSNVAGKAYAMNVITPMRPALTWINRSAFMVSRAFPATLQGLLGLGLIHFARWVIIKRDQWPQRGQPKQTLVNDYMLFGSNFNGTWDQYIDAFADGLPSGLDLLWYASTKYPHSIPITPFKNYIRVNQIDTGYYYNATPGSAQRDIKAALVLVAGLRAIDAGSLEDDELGAAYDALLLTVQGGLGAPGYAPVASCDTSVADRHRAIAVRERWGPHGTGAPPATRLLAAVAPAVVRGAAGDEDEKQAVRAAVGAVVASASRIGEAPSLDAPAPTPATAGETPDA
ncbi:hypothetical protein U1872_02900 [Sphingomonas sp. RB3P16]|uniref:hypothetical protein n=1 Tax=Parasphingomonas frigoris TaxID=3096163 RepID=UPI002FC9B83C